MSQLVKISEPLGFSLIPRNMQEAVDLAKLMCTAKMIPAHLRTPGDALMVIEQAMRWNMSPFAVAQCTSSIHGKLMFEGKLVAAAVETSGAIEGGFDYKFSGEGNERAITVRAVRRGETEAREITIELKQVRTDQKVWIDQPDQQLVYYGTRAWARRWTPSVMLGVYAPEDFGRETRADSIEGEPPAEVTAKPTPSSASNGSLRSYASKVKDQTEGPLQNDQIPSLDNAPPREGRRVPVSALPPRVDAAIQACASAIELKQFERFNFSGLISDLEAAGEHDLEALLAREIEYHRERLAAKEMQQP